MRLPKSMKGKEKARKEKKGEKKQGGKEKGKKKKARRPNPSAVRQTRWRKDWASWGLQLKLVAEGQLHHIGVAVAVLGHLGDADIVASVDHEVVKLVGHTHGDGKVERVDMAGVILVHHEARLDTALSAKFLAT